MKEARIAEYNKGIVLMLSSTRELRRKAFFKYLDAEAEAAEVERVETIKNLMRSVKGPEVVDSIGNKVPDETSTVQESPATMVEARDVSVYPAFLQNEDQLSHDLVKIKPLHSVQWKKDSNSVPLILSLSSKVERSSLQ